MAISKGTVQGRSTGSQKVQTTGTNGSMPREHRTAKIVELVASSKKSFEDAIRNALKDSAATTRGITGAHILNMSVRCDGGKILEYKVNMNVAFGIERTKAP
ncbi:MAG TPA: dodecin family protein [Candidatus Thermoplasmatota archaeon]|nr:dodecin family protein [Candidatus Thermoplasmatota archaeon]